MNDASSLPKQSAPSFQERFCALYHCPEKKFGRKLFWRCLHYRSLPFAAVMVLCHPRFFTVDFNLLEELRDVRDRDELVALIDNYREHCYINRNFLHEQLRFRISGRRLIAIYESLGLN